MRWTNATKKNVDSHTPIHTHARKHTRHAHTSTQTENICRQIGGLQHSQQQSQRIFTAALTSNHSSTERRQRSSRRQPKQTPIHERLQEAEVNQKTNQFLSHLKPVTPRPCFPVCLARVSAIRSRLIQGALYSLTGTCKSRRNNPR